MNSSAIYRVNVDQRSINQILRDGGFDDAKMAMFWDKVGYPLPQNGPAKKISLAEIIQSAATKLISG